MNTNNNKNKTLPALNPDERLLTIGMLCGTITAIIRHDNKTPTNEVVIQFIRDSLSFGKQHPLTETELNLIFSENIRDLNRYLNNLRPSREEVWKMREEDEKK